MLKTKKAVSKFKAIAIKNYKVALEDKEIDVIFIASSTATHINFIREAAKPLSEAIKEWVDCKDEETDIVNKPPHYTEHPSGIECIQVTEHMGFNLGNAIKYIWRCDLKKDAIEDLKKAKWYIEREISKREQHNL